MLSVLSISLNVIHRLSKENVVHLGKIYFSLMLASHTRALFLSLNAKVFFSKGAAGVLVCLIESEVGWSKCLLLTLYFLQSLYIFVTKKPN